MTDPQALTRSLTTQSVGVPEIGSDFELAEQRYLGRPDGGLLPWEDAADITYVESGRQALAVAQTALRSQGHSHLYVPSYLCDSMISAFAGSGWSLGELPVDDDLVVCPADLTALVNEGVVLHAPYFGRQDSPAMLEALDILRQRGVVVVVDETHRILSGPSQVADIRVASLRKLLPVYDGGYVTGLSAQLHPTPAILPESKIAALRKMAMVSKTAALARGEGGKGYLALFARAERATKTRTQPVQMSEESLALLGRLDLHQIRTSRQDNAAVLTQALIRTDWSGRTHRFRVINPPSEDLSPSHLVLEADDVSGLQQFLSARHIYCPIHWPPSSLLPKAMGWPVRYISLPIDHRYGEADMLRVAAGVDTFYAENYSGQE